jgi:hypothetical protein
MGARPLPALVYYLFCFIVVAQHFFRNKHAQQHDQARLFANARPRPRDARVPVASVLPAPAARCVARLAHRGGARKRTKTPTTSLSR